jgi:TonB family protein
MIDDRTLLNLLAWWSQIALLVVAAAALPRLLKVVDPDVRHLYWRVLLVLCLTLPLIEPWQSPAQVVSFAASARTSGAAVPDASLQSGADVPTLVTGPIAHPYVWLARLTLLFAIVAVGRVTWLMAGIFRLRRLRRAGSSVAPADVTGDADVLPTAADIRYVPGISQPITFGVRRPVICLPSSLRTTHAEMRHVVLAHELWHVRRRDWMWLVAEETVRSLLWFHPAIHWVVSRVQRSREEVVDELTVLETNARRTYLEALLAFADGPVPFPVAPFARRRHLFQRIQLISREAVMSSQRLAVSSAVMIAVVAVASLYGAARFPLTAQSSAAVQTPRTPPPPPPPPPRDPRPGAPRPATTREGELKKSIAAEPGKPALYLELAKLQEDRNAIDEAEATLNAARAALPNNTAVLTAVAQFYHRHGDFQRTIQALEEIAALDPSDPSRHQMIATFYWEKAFKDKSLSPGDKLAYIQSGIAATDRAIALNADYLDALTYKNILLRMQAQVETDPTRQQQLITEADQLRSRAMQIQQARSGKDMPPPPPPPPPPGSNRTLITADGLAPVRVGGNIKPPTKIKDVRPVYPEEAMAAKVTGVVIIEATIDPSGHVSDTRVLKSIPLLDQAAVDAVRQWEFTPTNLNGVPVPVVMTVTVNFSLQ